MHFIKLKQSGRARFNRKPVGVCTEKQAYRRPLQGKCPSKNIPQDLGEDLVWNIFSLIIFIILEKLLKTAVHTLPSTRCIPSDHLHPLPSSTLFPRMLFTRTRVKISTYKPRFIGKMIPRLTR